MSLKLVLLASTRMMFAAGAIAWAQLNVQALLHRPPARARDGRIIRAAGLIDLLEAGRVGQVDLRIVVELVQVARVEARTGAVNEVRIVVGIDDNDCLTALVGPMIEP